MHLGHADEVAKDMDLSIKSYHLEIPALQMFFERTSQRMKQMNIEAR